MRRKDYKKILRERISTVPKGYRFISDHYEDCLEIMVQTLGEVIDDFDAELNRKRKEEGK